MESDWLLNRNQVATCGHARQEELPLGGWMGLTACPPPPRLGFPGALAAG